MVNYKVIFTNNSELAEYETVSKGDQNDVFVKIQDDYYSLRIYDIIRLEVSTENVMKIISNLYDDGYFSILNQLTKKCLMRYKFECHFGIYP
jgi:hypothetical protein